MATTKTFTKPVYGVYTNSALTMKVSLSISEVGKNIKQNLEYVISKKTEGRCIKEGFVKPNSIRLLTYSSGAVQGDVIVFETVFECKLCNPVEGMNITDCVAKTITKAGIHAEVIDQDGVIPVTIFIARDHHFQDKLFSTVTEGSKINVRVIGSRFELNDPYICVIAKLLEPQAGKGQGQGQIGTKKPITILEE
jgi:DNA-directed RNA polymerase subunit E'/Rpb7